MKPSPALKQKILSVCLNILDERIKALRASLRDLTEGAENDAKSSAGDKHETARAMMQLEHENISRQLDELLKEKNELVQTDITTDTIIHKGSLIRTNHRFLFLSIALGKVEIDGTEVMALSPQSPLGRKLIGLSASDVVEMNGIQYTVEEVN
jgi:hypothetical protein